MRRAKVLIVGSSGYIGQRIVGRVGLGRVVATYHEAHFDGGVHFDIATTRLADRFLRGSHGISHAILLQGITNIDRCAQAPCETASVNVAGTIRAIDDLLDAAVKPIFISSDAVFDGILGLRTEDDPVSPILTYGAQKVAVEDYLLKVCAPWAVVRLTKVIGSYINPRNILFEWLQSAKAGQIIRCATDQILSPVDVDDVVDAVLSLIRSNLNGLFHVCGSTEISRHDLLQLLLTFAPEEFRAHARAERCSLDDFEFKETRPKMCSLSNAKFVRTSGMKMRSVERTCFLLATEFFSESVDAVAWLRSEPIMRGRLLDSTSFGSLATDGAAAID